MRIDQNKKLAEQDVANDQVAGDEVVGDVGLSSAMHDMQSLAKSYRTHREQTQSVAPIYSHGAPVDPRVLLIPRQEPRPDHWKLATLLTMVLLGLSTSALAVSLAFRGTEEVALPYTRKPVIPEPQLVLPVPTIDVPATDASISKEPTSYQVLESPESSQANPVKHELVVPHSAKARVSQAPVVRKRKSIRQIDRCDEVARLLGEAGADCAAEESEPATKNSADEVAARPYRLSRAQVMTPMQSIRGRVLACYDEHDFSGVAMVTIVIAPEGQVQSFELDDGSAPFQACVEKLVTKLEFPKLSQSFTLSYPFTLRN